MCFERIQRSGVKRLVSSPFRWSWVTVNCHWVQRRRSESIRRSRSASGATSVLRPWLARSNTRSQQSNECSASRSSRSGVYDRTAVSAGDPTTAIVWSTRVTLVAATTTVRATDKCFDLPSGTTRRAPQVTMSVFNVRNRW